MSFINITDPKERDNIVQDYLKTVKNIKQQKRKEKLGDMARIESTAKLFSPLVADITAPIKQEIQTLKIQPPPQLAISDSPIDTYGVLASQYLRLALNKHKTLDTTFGIYNKDSNFFIGNEQIQIRGDDIIIDDKVYTGSKGLWELIIKKNPVDYTEEDRDRYKEILYATNVLYKNNDANQTKPRSSKAEKWTKILRPIWNNRPSSIQEITGDGIIYLSQDPVVLTNRLSLLIAEYQAGNTTTQNEMVAIIDELLKQSIITKDQYEDLNSALFEKYICAYVIYDY